MEGLEGNGFFRLLALGNVTGDAGSAEEAARRNILIGVVNALRTEDGDDHPVVEMPDARALGLEADLEIGRCPLADPAFMEGVTGLLEVVVMNDARIVLAQQFVAGVAEQGFDAAVDEDEPAFAVEGVDEIRRLVDQETVQALGLLQACRHQRMLALHTAALQGAVDGAEQIGRVAVLADELEGPLAQCMNGRVDALVGTEDDDRGLDVIAGQPVHDLETADVRQVQVEDDDINVALGEPAQSILAGGAFFNLSLWAGQQSAIGTAEAYLVIDDQQAAAGR